MGSKESKSKQSSSKTTQEEKNNPNKETIREAKPADLTEKDYEFLSSQTGILRADIKSILDKFNENNPDAKLNKKEFIRLYQELRPEPENILDEISEHVFRCFDTDQNGYISFYEFLIAYALTSRGYLYQKSA